MKIFILSPFEDTLLQDTGYSNRIYNLAKGLAKLGNEVSIIIPGFTMSSFKVDNFSVYRLRGFLPKKLLDVIAKVLGIASSASLYFYDPLFILKACKLLSKSDVVQIEEQPAGGFFVPLLAKIMKKIVAVDCHDVFQSLRLKHTSKIRRILETTLEIFIYRIAALIFTVSEKEKNILTSSGVKENKIRVVPNGVDTEKFNRSAMDVLQVKRNYNLENCYVVTFVGNMEYLPNAKAVELIVMKIVPLVCREINNVKFLIVGRLGRYRSGVKAENLVFTGVVKDVAKLLNASDVAIAPLFHGSGTRLKILEYLSCGLPVVSTTKGVEGLDIKNRNCIIIEDDVHSFAKSIVRILKNPNLANAMRQTARSSISNYDWRNIVAQLHKIYSEYLQHNQISHIRTQ